MLIISNKSKKKNDKIKGILYGNEIKNIKIEFSQKNKYYYSLKKNDKIKLKLINKYYNVIIKEIKKHPYKKSIVHIEFFLNAEKNI